MIAELATKATVEWVHPIFANIPTVGAHLKRPYNAELRKLGCSPVELRSSPIKEVVDFKHYLKMHCT
jgi:hypothetical protein